MVPSGLTALAADLVVILHFSAARVSLPTYSLKTAAMINCSNAWIASAPSLFVAESILHRALAIIEWKQTHSLGLAIPWDISRHNPSASLLAVCSVFSICTWHRMLEQCTEETSSSRLDCGELRVRIIMTEDNSRKHSDYWGVFIKYLQIRRQPEDLGLGQQTLSRALFGLRGLDKSHLSFICGCLLW